MKVAYIGKIQLSDVDLSYLHEAQQMVDMTYIMEVTPRFMRGPAFNIPAVYPKTGVFKAVNIYPEFRKYSEFIDIDKFYVVNTCGKLWYLKAFWTNFLLLLFLIRNKFDVLHLAWAPNLYEFIIYYLRHKMMLTVHDPFPHTGLDTFIVRLRRKVAFFLIPRLIILNKAQKQEFINYYLLPPEQVINSQLSSYTYLRTVRQNVSCLPKLNRYVLFVGKIHPYKGLEYLLPAMEKVHKECPDCCLVVAGSGTFSFDIDKYKSLSYIEIRNRFIPDEELVTLICHSEFIVCPYTDATQSGVIMSAYAFCKPVIATNVGGLPEMVKHNQYGLIVQEKNVDTLADAIVSLWRQPQLVDAFSHQIESNYEVGNLSWRKIAEDLLKEYRAMLKS